MSSKLDKSKYSNKASVETAQRKEKFEFTTEGTWQQRQSNFIRYVEQIEDATVNVTIKWMMIALS